MKIPPFSRLLLSSLSFVLLISFDVYSQNVGIGTVSPKAKFHVVGNVRFEALQNNNSVNRVAVMDSNGNLYWKSQDSLFANNAWLLDGNVANFNQFIGTINDQRLVFKTNNFEQMTVLTNGNIGLGTSFPDRKLVLYNSLPDFNNELVLKQTGQSKLGAYVVLDNTANPGGKYWSIGSSGPLNTAGQLGVPGSLEFYQFDAGPSERARMIITPQGLVGIHTVPTARFHVNGSVKFENLSTGSGTALVIAPNGEVMRSSTQLFSLDSLSTTQVQLDNLSQEINNLKAKVSKLESQVQTLSNNN